jgi:hypothetical protein
MSDDAEPLTTGWEPDLPVEDTLLRRYLFHWASYCAAIVQAGGGAVTWTDDFAAADLRRPSGYYSSATMLRPWGHDADRVLDRIDEFFADGWGEVLLWSAWPTPDLRERGWNLEGHPPLLVRPPATMLPPPDAPEVDVRRIEDPATLAEWERVVVEGYPIPTLEGAAPGTLAAPSLLDDERLAFWLGRDEAGRAVSVGTSYVDHGIASFALGVTRPEARRRGHWLRHAVERLEHSPDLWMTGVFSDYSRPGAESIGFVPVLRLALWTRYREQ